MHKVDENPWPRNWSSEKLNSFQRLLVLNAIMPDKVKVAIQELVIEVLGKQFVEYPTFNLDEAYKASRFSTPIIFILSPGADPLVELRNLAEKMGFKNQLSMLSLGQGQGAIAVKEIERSKKEGSWVVLQNCHLAASFMPELEKKIDELKECPKPEFRLWLTSMPASFFPVSVLQNGIKITNEAHKGLKNNLLRAYQSFDGKFMDSCSKQEIWRKLLFGLCLFNAIVLERRKFGPLGWNIPYEFSQSDLLISISQLQMFLNEYEDIQWDALNYMVAEANYGGRVTDPMDRRTIKILLSDFYTKEILEPGYLFSDRKEYIVPEKMDLFEYLSYIKSLPINDYPEVFGLHSNADITCALNESSTLLSTALSLLPRTTEGGTQSQETILEEKSRIIQEKIPEEFNIEECAKSHPINYEESMNTVLQQELMRFNNLIKTVKSSLIQLNKAIKGLVVFSSDLEAVGNSLFDNQVPELWQKSAYPSLKPLASWVLDFIQRIKFLQDCIAH